MLRLLLALAVGLLAVGPLPAAEKETRLFELRVYYAAKGKLDAVNARFRDHTVKLFEKHGMTNVAYWNLADGDKATCEKLLKAATATGGDKCEVDPKKAAKGVALVYLLAHASPEAGKKSFDTFRADPDWVKAKDASEKAAGGSLTVKDGVKSLYLKPTDYSPTK